MTLKKLKLIQFLKTVSENSDKTLSITLELAASSINFII